jgi:hypothetical protein
MWSYRLPARRSGRSDVVITAIASKRASSAQSIRKVILSCRCPRHRPPMSRIDELLPWAHLATAQAAVAL